MGTYNIRRGENIIDIESIILKDKCVWTLNRRNRQMDVKCSPSRENTIDYIS
uniref:Uncharacterized protein n=1 Tax=Strongyloides venezuelensis TaxID=75913 RepID=A0A0K0FLX9_STRVS